jgi:hypothetical protein
MSQSVEPLTVNGNQLNLSDQASVLAYWVADTLDTGASGIIDLDTGASGIIDPPRADPSRRVTRRHPPSFNDTARVGKVILVGTYREDVATTATTPGGQP